MNRYPRDMHGHGATPPDANWPNGARIAVQFVVNYEEGGENNILHGDQASEAFLSEIVGASAWQNQRHWNMESIYEYGARAGFWRLHRLFTSTAIPVTVYGVATALARSPEQTNAMIDAGWEIASHGLKWVEYKDYAEADEREDMQAAIKLHNEVTGARPAGWYTGRCSINTERLVAEEGGFSYVADSYADDLPYWTRYGTRDQLVIPYTLDCNDMRFATPQGFNSGDQFESYLRDTFDALYEEGGKMMSVGLHCRLIGRPGRIQALKRFIAYAQSHADVWFARRIDIADHWAAHHPPKTTPKPSQMQKSDFVTRYGGVFAHSAWIAEGAFDLELGPAHDTVTGLHAALARVFRAANETQRLDVLDAHPDLSETLDPAKSLSRDDALDQSSADLGKLTEDELTELSILNEEYTVKHGFPFIIAVQDHDKRSIRSALKSRIANDSEVEFTKACQQVERIALLRLTEIFD